MLKLIALLCALSVAQTTSSMWKFRGVDSYLRIGQDYLQLSSLSSGQKAFVVQFKIFTKQKNSLLFLIGETTDQFFAMELRNGKFVITCNFDFPGGPTNRTLTDYNRDITRRNNPDVVKAGILPKLKLLVLSINTQLNLRVKYDKWSPALTGDAWIGGVYNDNVKDIFRPYLAAIDDHYRGCMGNIAVIHNVQIDPYEVKERIRVEQTGRFCTRFGRR